MTIEDVSIDAEVFQPGLRFRKPAAPEGKPSANTIDSSLRQDYS